MDFACEDGYPIELKNEKYARHLAYCFYLILLQPPPTLPKEKFSDEFIDFVDRW